MAKITSLTVCGFRGIRTSITIKFGQNGRSLVLSGENGRGKSSFVDAVEWYFLDDIQHLKREGCQEQAYRHYRLRANEVAEVQVVTDNVDVFGAKQLDSSFRSQWINIGTNLSTFVQNAKGESLILRHAQLKDFVYLTKTRKLEAIARIVGFESVAEARDALLKTRNALERDTEFQNVRGALSEKTRDIEAIIETIPDSPVVVLVAADVMRQQVGGEIAIKDAISFKNSVEKILTPTQNDIRSRRSMNLRTLARQVSQAVISLAILNLLKQYADAYASFLAKKDTVEKLALSNLYKAGLDVLRKSSKEFDRCPLCGGPISHQDLTSRLELDLQAFGAVMAEQKNLEQQRINLASQLQATIDNLDKTLTAVSDIGIADATAWLTIAQANLGRLREWRLSVAQSAQASQMPYRANEADTESVQTYNGMQRELSSKIEAEIQALSETEAERTRNQLLEKLKALQAAFDRWLELREKEKKFSRQIATMQRIVEAFERVERDELNNVLNAISQDVSDFYLALHPNEGFDQIRLVPTQDRGLEFHLLFKGDPITPPTRLLSESHLNTLGLCFFLASAVHINRNCDFIVLDDVVSSVDANHRLALARLLRDDPRLASKQLIVLSHDLHWSDILKQTFPHWMHKRIESWDYDLGLTIDDIQELRNQITDALIKGDAVDAAHKLRMLTEAVFQEICEHYNVPMPYRRGTENEKRDLIEFISAVKRFFRKNNRFDPSQPPLLDIEQCLWLMNITSHPDPRRLSVSSGDVQTLLNDLDRFRDCFYCHIATCKYRDRKLRWDSNLGAFQSCKECNAPV